MSCGDLVVLPFIARTGCCQPPLTPDEQAALRTRIATLQLALDQMYLGYRVTVSVDQNGERLEFAGGTSTAQLKAYIQTLSALLPDYCPVGGVGGVARPMQFLF